MDDDFSDVPYKPAFEPIAEAFRLINFVNWELFHTPPIFLIEGLIEKNSITIFYGSPKAGKSFLAIDLMVSLSTSSHWLGASIPQPAKVMYLAWEDGKSLILRAVCAHRSKSSRQDGQSGYCEIADQPPDIFGPHFEDWLIYKMAPADEFDDDDRPHVMIIDTLALAMAGLGDENSSATMGIVIDKLRRIRNLGVTVLVLHHSGKDAAKGLRGHNSLEAAADSVFLVQNKGTSNVITLKRERYRNGTTGETFRFAIKTAPIKPDYDKSIPEQLVPYLSEIKSIDDAETRNVMTRPQILVLNSIQRLLQTDPTDVGMMFGKAGYHAAVSYKLIEEDCIQKNISPNAKNPASPKKAVRRALDYLVESRMADERDGFIWPVAMEQTDSDKTESS